MIEKSMIRAQPTGAAVAADGVKPDPGGDIASDGPTASSGPNLAAASSAQRRLWFACTLQRDDAQDGWAHHSPIALEIPGTLDFEALSRALDGAVARHDSLRTTFSEIDGEVMRRVGAPYHVDIPISNIGNRDERVFIEVESNDAFRSPLDLTAGPLIRARLLRISDAKHVLVIILHHIVTDGWSNRILVAELEKAYRALCIQRPPDLPALILGYGDVVTLERQRADSGDQDADATFWRAHLGDGPFVLELPYDRTPVDERGHVGAREMFVVPGGTARRLDAIARSCRSTPYQLFLAVVQTLLARWTNQRHVIVGTPVANRLNADVENVIGLFANILPVRTSIDERRSFIELLVSIRDESLEVYEHQALSFHEIVEAVSPDRELSRSPLIQAALTFGEDRPYGETTGDWKTLDVFDGSSYSHYDLVFDVRHGCEETMVTITYAREKFLRESIFAIGSRLLRLLADVATKPEERLMLLGNPPPNEQRYLLAQTHETPSGATRSLLEVFEEQVVLSPHRAAVVDGSQTYTYAELDLRVRQIANLCVSGRVRCGTSVGVYSRRSLDWVAAILAIWKIGAVYVPLDSTYPSPWLSHVVSDADIEMILTDDVVQARRCSDTIPVTWLGEESNMEAATSQRAMSFLAGQIAAIFYTSGSTGKPKGVELTHAGLSNYVEWYIDEFGISIDDRAVQLINVAVDASVLCIFAPLSCGASVFLAPAELRLDPKELWNRLAEAGVTTGLIVTPVFLSTIKDVGDFANPTPRSIQIGGDRLSALPDKLPFPVFNLYGPTEATIAATCGRVLAGKKVDIGKPIRGMAAYILDELFRLAPEGVLGEIYLAGVGVAQGYRHRPGMTASRFLPCPFGLPGSRMYKTGDLGRWLPDGTIEFCGRRDQQVKIRGHRVELEDIERALLAEEGVSGAFVLPFEAKSGETRLVAYLVLESRDNLLDKKALRARLRVTLPLFMVPAAFIVLDEFPLSQNGKIDAKALPPPALDNGNAPSEEMNPTQAAVAKAFEKVLAIQGVGLNDNFFDLGGHSLVAMQLVSALRQLLGISPSLKLVFENATVLELSAALQSIEPTKSDIITRCDRGRPTRVSFAQERLFFLHELEDLGHAYNVCVTWKISGPLSLQALNVTLSELLSRHEILRAHFERIDDGIVQVIRPAHVVSLSAIAISEGDLAKQIRNIADPRFDLLRGPLLRMSLFDVGNENHVLALAMHHIITDAWSIDILKREFAAIYSVLTSGTAPLKMPEPPLQYGDYAEWQRLTAAIGGDSAVQYWKERLSDAPSVIDLPLDRKRGRSRSFMGSSVEFKLNDAVVRRLEELGADRGASCFMTFLALFKILLVRLSNQEDVVVGAPIAGRELPETHGLLGLFLNTLALRTNISGLLTFDAVLLRVRETVLGGFANQAIPFEKVVEAVAPARDLSHHPVFQTAFVFKEARTSRVTAHQVSIDDLVIPSSPRSTTKFDLTLIIEKCQDGVTASFEYATDIFDEATIIRFGEYYRRLANAMAEGWLRPIAFVPLCVEGAQKTSVREFSLPIISGLMVHELFSAQAARTPDAAAISDHGRELSYSEVDRLANSRARRLESAGVRPGDCVGVHLTRGSDCIVTMLAIMKAGAAYVPLDPAYPDGRLKNIIDGAEFRAIVSDSRRSGFGDRGDVLVISVVERPGDDQSDGSVVAKAGSDLSLACVIYTSGTSGHPKGSMITHRGIVNLIFGTYRRWSDAKPFLQISGIGYDAMTFEVWGALTHGGCCVIVDDRVVTPESLRRHLSARGESAVALLTPALFNALVEEDQHCFSGLGEVFVGGEAPSPSHGRQAVDANPGLRMINAYGPAECSVMILFGDLDCENQTAVFPLMNILEGTKVHIVGRYGELVCDGAIGELCVSGTPLARGYYRKPGLTARRFIASPFDAGERLYRTGDLARRRIDGGIEILGRLDRQIKIRGQRTEPAEIEWHLLQEPDIAAALVTLRESETGDNTLVAYIVTPQLDQDHLTRLLSSRLPAHMVPSAFVNVSEFPLTPNGKIDIDELPLWRIASPGQGDVPTTKIERELLKIFSEVLKADSMGINDDFFCAGGHSLFAMRVVSRIRQYLGIDVSVRAIFEYPTVATLALSLEKGTPLLPRIERFSHGQSLPPAILGSAP